MMIEELIPSGKFTQPQLELLRMFSKQYPDRIWVEVKDMIAKYLMEKATEEMDNVFNENGWGEEKVQEWSKEHMRTSYDTQ